MLDVKGAQKQMLDCSETKPLEPTPFVTLVPALLSVYRPRDSCVSSQLGKGIILEEVQWWTLNGRKADADDPIDPGG